MFPTLVSNQLLFQVLKLSRKQYIAHFLRQVSKVNIFTFLIKWNKKKWDVYLIV